jgi:hypothetical protein
MKNISKSEYGLLVILILNAIGSLYLGFVHTSIAWFCAVFLQGRVIVMLNNDEDETSR